MAFINSYFYGIKNDIYIYIRYDITLVIGVISFHLYDVGLPKLMFVGL